MNEVLYFIFMQHLNLCVKLKRQSNLECNTKGCAEEGIMAECKDYLGSDSERKRIHGVVTDRLGNEYDSVEALCNKYKITTYRYYYVIKHNQVIYTDKFGNVFRDKRDLCYTYSLTPEQMVSLIKDPDGDVARRVNEMKFEDLNLEYQSFNFICLDSCCNVYDSVEGLCSAFNLSVSTLMRGLKKNVSLERILSSKGEYQITKMLHDHLGNEYISTSEMCERYNISVEEYNKRLVFGNTVEASLTGIGLVNRREVIDHNGVKYKCMEDMLNTYGVSRYVFNKRQRECGSLEYCLTGHKDENSECVYDHIGRPFKTMTDMCLTYGIPLSTLYSRLNGGVPLCSALLLKSSVVHKSKVYTDFMGGSYKSLSAMQQFWHIADLNRLCTIIQSKSKSSCVLTKAMLDSLDISFNDRCYNGLNDLCEQLRLAKSQLYRGISSGMNFEEAVDFARLRQDL